MIDEDQGRSGTTAEGRLGFQRLLAEVSLNHVGIILGTEMSRLARSNKDWHQLIELCGIFRTLLADQDGLYDPTDDNDRLLLGLRGMMSEAEIHILKGRMHAALLNKARRGDLYMLPLVGYVKLRSGPSRRRRDAGPDQRRTVGEDEGGSPVDQLLVAGCLTVVLPWSVFMTVREGVVTTADTRWVVRTGQHDRSAKSRMQ